jgi:hypothetical protein
MKILDIKKTIQKNNEEIIDFCEPSFIPDDTNPNYIIHRLVKVTEDYSMRPDLLSKVLYNDVSKYGEILKINEISDPLSIKEGDILLSLYENRLDSFYVNPVKETNENNYTRLTDPTKVSKKDKNRLDLLKKISEKIKNGSSQNIKTNQLPIGQSNIITDENTNTIIF